MTEAMSMVKFSIQVSSSVFSCFFKKETTETKEMTLASASVCLILVTALAISLPLIFRFALLTWKINRKGQLLYLKIPTWLQGLGEKKLIIHPWSSMRFLLFYSPKHRSQVGIS